MSFKLERYKIYTTDFEFDSGRSGANKEKHGIGFVGAQALWDDPDLIEIPARTIDEPRQSIIKVWVAECLEKRKKA